MPGWRAWAHSLSLKQLSNRQQRRPDSEVWDDPVSVMPIGVHDFPDKQRPLYGIQGIAGPAVGEHATVLLGSLAGDAGTRTGGVEIALQMVYFRNLITGSVDFSNIWGWSNAGVAMYTPLNAPEPDPTLNNFAQRFAFLRPRPPSPSAGVGRAEMHVGTNSLVQSVVQFSPTFYQDTSQATNVLAGVGVTTTAFPSGRFIYFNPPLIIPATQFLAFTTFDANVPGAGQGNQLFVSAFYREVSA